MAATRHSTGKNEPFKKKIPQNPRYKHIKSTLDTGASVTKYMSKIEEMRKNYRYRKDEIFKRMKVSTFAQLVLQVADVVNIELERQELETARTESEFDDAEPQLDSSKNGSISERSLLENVVQGLGEVELSEQNGPDQLGDEEQKQSFVVPEITSLPYLLLDVRDKDAFNECHIIGALSYPAPMLTRSVNYLLKEMVAFRNKPGKIIVVYDDDEKRAPNVATVLVQREMDNVIMLSGGMKVLNKKFPGCFMSGTLPSTCFSPVLDRKGKPKHPRVVTENVGVEWYTPDLLELIQDYLEEILLGNETSRMSSRTTTRSTSARSTVSNKSSTTQKSWR